MVISQHAYEILIDLPRPMPGRVTNAFQVACILSCPTVVYFGSLADAVKDTLPHLLDSLKECCTPLGKWQNILSGVRAAIPASNRRSLTLPLAFEGSRPSCRIGSKCGRI